MQQHDCPQRHGENGRAEIRRRYREQRNADHQQHRHGGVRGADDGAAQRKHAPIGRDHANLCQRIDAEQAGETERDLGQPIGQRRTDVAAELEFVTDGEQLRQLAGRRRIKYHRHHQPNERLCQRRRPEQQVRARAQRLNVKRNVEHRALRDTLTAWLYGRPVREAIRQEPRRRHRQLYAKRQRHRRE